MTWRELYPEFASAWDAAGHVSSQDEPYDSSDENGYVDFHANIVCELCGFAICVHCFEKGRENIKPCRPKHRGGTMYFKLYRDANRQWRWSLYAGNNRVIAVSGESYHNRPDAMKAIELVKGSADAPVRKLRSKKGSGSGLFAPDGKFAQPNDPDSGLGIEENRTDGDILNER